MISVLGAVRLETILSDSHVLASRVASYTLFATFILFQCSRLYSCRCWMFNWSFYDSATFLCPNCSSLHLIQAEQGIIRSCSDSRRQAVPQTRKSPVGYLQLRPRFDTRSYRICGGRSGTRQVSSSSFGSPAKSHRLLHTHPLSGACTTEADVPSGRNLTPPHKLRIMTE
jgi:hypothetical protein